MPATRSCHTTFPMQQVQLRDVAPQSWRNGGGSTRELLAWPPTTNLHDWQLRVSVATIAHSAAFSSFAGITRWFVVLQGAGLRLDLPGGPRVLTCADAPLQFEGEAAPHCQLLDGPTLDLNFMARRGAGSSCLQAARAGSDLPGAFAWRALYAADAATLDVDGVAQPLAANTLFWTDSQDSSRWHLRQAGRAWWLTWEAP
jgi:uncharacterized protein